LVVDSSEAFQSMRLEMTSAIVGDDQEYLPGWVARIEDVAALDLLFQHGVAGDYRESTLRRTFYTLGAIAATI
jgi:hypothetical protein